MTRRVLFFIVVFLQTCFLLGMIYFHQHQLESGFPVRLLVNPVDPQDLMRGEYTRLSYPISNLDLTKLPHDPGVYKNRSALYVTLSKDTSPNSPLWIPKAVKMTKPDSSEFPFIKGTVLWHNQYSSGTVSENSLQVDYPIDSFYVQEGRAIEIESAMGRWNNLTTHRVSAEIRLTKNGSPVVSKIFIDNKEFR